MGLSGEGGGEFTYCAEAILGDSICSLYRLGENILGFDGQMASHSGFR